MRKPIIAGNWKMNMSVSSAEAFVKEIASSIEKTDVEAVVCAPFTILPSLVKAAEGTKLGIGAQNMFFEDSGAYTGEISPDMLVDIGVKYVILGHSERRQLFSESDKYVNLKAKKALEKGLIPIVCCGETLQQREDGITKKFVSEQIEKAFEGIAPDDAKKVIVAYEPIWAIGTGKTASSSDAQDVIAAIRKELENLYGSEISEEIRIQYGGSVKPSNIEELMNQTDIDGALVGGASLKAQDFEKLVNF